MDLVACQEHRVGGPRILTRNFLTRAFTMYLTDNAGYGQIPSLPSRSVLHR